MMISLLMAILMWIAAILTVAMVFSVHPWALLLLMGLMIVLIITKRTKPDA